MAKTILIGGGSGLIGRSVTAEYLNRGWDVRILTRGPARIEGKVQYFTWDPKIHDMDLSAFLNVNVVLNLAGSPIVDHAWSDAYKTELLSSRISALETLHRGLEKANIDLDHIICASAIGYYGDRGHLEVDEYSMAGQGFLSDLVVKWEASAKSLADMASSFAIVRIGLVLDSHSGFYEKMAKPLPFFIAPYFGKGEDWYSWIHIRDLTGMIHFIVDRKLSGTFNGVSPNASQAKAFMDTLRQVINPNALLLPISKVIIKTVLPQRSEALLMSSHVLPKRIKSAGYAFKYAELKMAVEELNT